MFGGGRGGEVKPNQKREKIQKLNFISVIFCLDTSVLYFLLCVKKDSSFDFAYQITFLYHWEQRAEILFFQDFYFANKFPSSSDSLQNSIFTVFIEHYSPLQNPKYNMVGIWAMVLDQRSIWQIKWQFLNIEILYLFCRQSKFESMVLFLKKCIQCVWN